MTKTIAQLWNGNIKPARASGENNPELKNLEELIERNFQGLKGHLGDSGLLTLGKYVDCINEYMHLTCEQAFCDGFSLGAKMTAEAFAGAEVTE